VYTVVYGPSEAVKRDVYTGYRFDLKGKSGAEEEKLKGRTPERNPERAVPKPSLVDRCKSLSADCLENQVRIILPDSVETSRSGLGDPHGNRRPGGFPHRRAQKFAAI
jgi:hypothetical protein